MSIKSITAKMASVLAVTGLAALSVIGTSGTADAASAQFRLCNYGSGYSVAARFPDRGGFETYVANYGQCVQVTVNTNEDFQLHASPGGNGAQLLTRIDRTYASGRTLVQTWGTFSSFSYGKLPY